MNAKKQSNKAMFTFSIIFQLLSVIFSILIFINDMTIILIGMLVYSIIISINTINNAIAVICNFFLSLFFLAK
mgnify:CR=1 FL=1